MAHELPKLDYDYNALEPHIDEQTMKIHHTKHHQTYVDKLNAAIAGTEFENMELYELVSDLGKIPEKIRQQVRNHGGGHANHSFFWSILKKDVPAEGEVIDAIAKEFGSFEKFKEIFTQTATVLFGSGWAWLVIKQGKLMLMGTPNQDCPWSGGVTPLIGIDLWEHSYYLRYMNKRPDYIQNFFSVINWEKVNELYLANK